MKRVLHFLFYLLIVVVAVAAVVVLPRLCLQIGTLTAKQFNGVSQKVQTEPICEGIAIGASGSLLAALVLGLREWIRQESARRQEVNYLRSLLTHGKDRVMAAKDTYHGGMKAWMKADELRAAQFNHMMKEVGVALEKRIVSLSPEQRYELYDTLDWYHTSGLHAVEREGQVEFTEIPEHLEGRWPTKTMKVDHAKRFFENLQSIKWLKFKAE
ncbi:MAG: hypothetical protein OXJ55_03305 [Caldilineaceae bacterium]|nr:hypothetical protein [Caldilineaceae bacterium]